MLRVVMRSREEKKRERHRERDKKRGHGNQERPNVCPSRKHADCICEARSAILIRNLQFLTKTEDRQEVRREWCGRLDGRG